MEMKKGIWTVASLDILPDEPIDMEAIESHSDRAAAVKACVRYIIERLELRTDLRYALMHDDLHPATPQEIADRSNMDIEDLLPLFQFDVNAEWVMPEALRPALESYFTEQIDMESGYAVETLPRSDIGAARFQFDVLFNLLCDEEDEEEDA